MNVLYLRGTRLDFQDSFVSFGGTFTLFVPLFPEQCTATTPPCQTTVFCHCTGQLNYRDLDTLMLRLPSECIGKEGPLLCSDCHAETKASVSFLCLMKLNIFICLSCSSQTSNSFHCVIRFIKGVLRGCENSAVHIDHNTVCTGNLNIPSTCASYLACLSEVC